MVTKQNLPQPKPQDRVKHPEATERDLNPQQAAVRTTGTAGATEPRTRPASEVKDIAAALPDFTSDELRQIPVVRPGARLKPGATYVDLRAVQRGTFAAPVEAYAGQDAWYVAKMDVAPPLWERLFQERTAALPDGRGRTRHVPQGEPALRGGRERAERRGGSPVASVQAPARHARARGH